MYPFNYGQWHLWYKEQSCAYNGFFISATEQGEKKKSILTLFQVAQILNSPGKTPLFQVAYFISK